MRWREYVWYRQLGQLLRLCLVALPLSFVLNRAAYRFIEPAFIGWLDYYTWPEVCLSNPAVVLIAICLWRLVRVVISIADRTQGQLSNPRSSGRVRFWMLDIGRLFLQCVFVCMAVAAPLLLSWAGVYRHYFDVGPYPATPILICLDRRWRDMVAARSPNRTATHWEDTRVPPGRYWPRFALTGEEKAAILARRVGRKTYG